MSHIWLERGTVDRELHIFVNKNILRHNTLDIPVTDSKVVLINLCGVDIKMGALKKKCYIHHPVVLL